MYIYHDMTMPLTIPSAC